MTVGMVISTRVRAANIRSNITPWTPLDGGPAHKKLNNQYVTWSEEKASEKGLEKGNDNVTETINTFGNYFNGCTSRM